MSFSHISISMGLTRCKLCMAVPGKKNNLSYVCIGQLNSILFDTISIIDMIITKCQGSQTMPSAGNIIHFIHSIHR